MHDEADFEEADEDGAAIDPRGVIADPTVELPRGYKYGVTRYADVVLANALSDRFDDLIKSLGDFEIDLDELRVGGGGRTVFVRRFDDSLGDRVDNTGASLWGKRNITIERRVGFDGGADDVSRVRGHEIDMFGQASAAQPFPGVAVEMEWNNKDPFYDRDLINFQALHREGAIVAGVIVTRGPTLQHLLSVVLDKYGRASTHWDKLTPRVNLGGGAECPLLLIGIEPDRITGVEAMWEHYAKYEEAQRLKENWRDGFDSWLDAQPEYDRLINEARIARIDRD